MKKNIILTSFFLLAFSSSLFAQYWTLFDADDTRERGYYDRPYKRYEAEPDWSQKGGNAEYLLHTFDQRNLQSEASNQQALQLININDYVEWTNDEAADGMTIRFSIPDAAAGGGTTGVIALYVDDIWVQDIELNSRWAWQYFFTDMRYSYADNTPGANKFARMRFDEVRVKLANKIPLNSKFKLLKKDNDGVAYTIDFVELEPIPAEVAAPDGAVVYSGDGSDLVSFIGSRSGQTIYIPAGYYEVPARINIVGAGAQLIGAGIWHTQLHFTGNPASTIATRGINTSASNVKISGLYLTTVSERRYHNYYALSKVGEGFSGSFGLNSVINDIWVTHFECGAWFNGANGLHIKNVRFRNNYADGINLARGSKNSTVEHCSFRNNGDDDMASWSSGNQITENIVFRHNISENCWRAAGVGFFGGKQNKALNLVIKDPLESAVRINNDFENTATFSNDGYFEIRDISIYSAGNKHGTPGQSGNLWGNRAGAVFISSSVATSPIDVRNLIFSNIDIRNSRADALMIQSGSDWTINNLTMENILVDGAALSTAGNAWTYYGLFFGGDNGVNNLLCVNFVNVADNIKMNAVPDGFLVNSDCEENTRIIRVNQSIDFKNFISNNFSENLDFTLIGGEDFVSVNAQGIVSGVQLGTAQLKITDLNNTANTITFTIIVKDVAATGMSISTETLRLCIGGGTHRLTATVLPSNATNKNYVWVSSSNTSVATVSGIGIVTPKAVGTTTIMARSTDGQHIASCLVTVVSLEDCHSDITVIETQDLSIAVYGNKIQISKYEEGEIISIYNLLGVKIYSQQLTGERTEIIRGLSDGIYVVTAEKAQKRQKVIIKN